MLLKLAWRNLWRNSRRSLIVLLSIVVGQIAILLYDSLSAGMILQMLDNQIGAHVSHMQIHKAGFNDNQILQNYLPDAERVAQALQSDPAVAHFSKRVICFGILSSATGSSGINMIGIQPEAESQITDIKSSMIDGQYLSGGRGEILIGKRLAEKLDVSIGDKVVAMASKLDGEVGSELFRVTGIFRTVDSEFDKTAMYVPIDNAREMLGLGEHLSEFAVIAKNLDALPDLKKRLEAQLNASGETYEILTYRELLPLLVMQVDVYGQAVIIFYAIIGLAMVFGIVNAMLMSVFERIREFGVLMAVGMRANRLFRMVMLEALMLGMVGTVTGVAIGYLLYLPLASAGIDLSAFSEGLNSFGVGTTIYPRLFASSIISALLVVPVIAVLAAVYPAMKAIRLTPVDAVRHA